MEDRRNQKMNKTTIDTIYQFCGGKYNGQLKERKDVEQFPEYNGVSKNYSKERMQNLVVPREELDEQPVLAGYLGPMYNGTTIYNGRKCVVIRYETQEIYDTYYAD